MTGGPAGLVNGPWLLVGVDLADACQTLDALNTQYIYQLHIYCTFDKGRLPLPPS